MTKIIMTLALFLSTHALSTERENIYLLTKFKSSKFVKHNSFKDGNGNIKIAPATFLMTFDVIERLQSEEEFNKSVISFYLNVSSDVPFTLSKGVALVVKRTDKAQYELLDWDFVGEVFCIKQSFVSEEYRDIYFKSPQKGDENKMCRFL